MSNDVKLTNQGSTSIYDALSFKTVQKTVPEPEVVEQPLPEITQLPAQDTTVTQPQNKGNVPATNVNFSDDDMLPSLAVLDENQQDPDLLPLLNIDGDQNAEKTEDYKPETSKDHSTKKLFAHLWPALGEIGTTKVLTNVVTRSTTKAVTKELTDIVAKAVASPVVKLTGKATAAKLGERLLEGATVGTAKTVVTVTGKGVASVGLKESAALAGNVFKGIVESGKAAKEIALVGGVTKIIPNTASALVKTSIGAGETVLKTGLEKGTQIAVENVLKTAGPEVAEKLLINATKTAAKSAGKGAAKNATKLTAEAFTKETTEAVTKATAEVAVKGSTKFAAGVAKVMPWVSTGIGVGITAWDTKDAITKSKDTNVSLPSKVFAWATVGLDVASTVSTATGKGKAFGWAATGLSIGTSFLSDYLK
jgi:hypothetical protein